MSLVDLFVTPRVRWRTPLKQAAIAVLLSPLSADATERSLLQITAHDRQLVVTDPSKGFNGYPKWVVFPPAVVSYRKVVLWITYACPEGLKCGEWDYVDNVMLRRSGGMQSPPQNIELARMISPYGARYGPEWSFTWQCDMTDFGFLLHDSVEIEFVHTGYESNTDRGWLVSLRFEILEGQSALPFLRMDTLWCGNFPYGDAARPIESLLSPITITPPDGARLGRVRVHQTGHGMDDSANCAEFCRKFRRVKLDGVTIDERYLWRECGDNPLHPQAGTWIFDRANWCPGAVAYPDMIDVPLDDSIAHSLELEMEAYINPNIPSAAWQLSSYIFYYGQPLARHDVAVDQILAPNDLPEHSRHNPVCGEPRFVMKNNGADTLRWVTVSFGLVGDYSDEFLWTGLLAPQETTTVSIAAPLTPDPNLSAEARFFVELIDPDDFADEAPLDNRMESSCRRPPQYPTTFVLSLLTNRDSSHNSITISDLSGQAVYERGLGMCNASRNYRDTLRLSPGCYKLAVEDTAGDGLDFWFNPEGGYGYVRLLDSLGRLLDAFDSDFGSGIEHWFTVIRGAGAPPDSDLIPLVQPFPARNNGTFSVDLFLGAPDSVELSIVTEDRARTVYSRHFVSFSEGMIPIDITVEPDGIYYVIARTSASTATRRIRVKRT